MLYMRYKEDVAVKKQKSLFDIELVQLTHFLPTKSVCCTTLEALLRQHHAQMHVCQMTDVRFGAERQKVSVYYCTRHKFITFAGK